jgi:protein TonB
MNSGSGNQTISGLVSSVPVNVPKASPHTVKISQGVSQGLITKKVKPVYPPQAQQMRLQGVVELMANISKEGNIGDVKVLSGPPVLAKAAVDAVKQWKYKPYFLNGEPVEVQTQVTINFQLP